MIPLVVFGVGGRMGRRVVELCGGAAGQGFTLVAGVERAEAAGAAPTLPGGAPVLTDVEEALRRAQAVADGVALPVVIDFTSPGALVALAPKAAAAGAALVSGTTGLAVAAEEVLAATARAVPVVWAPNMSLGVNLLYRLVELATRALPQADIEIVEAHHRHKADAPSGTAARLAEIAAETRRGFTPQGVEVKQGRGGLTPGGRPAGEIAVHSVRLGEVIGDHDVYFGLDHEVVRLSHRALGRDAFAAGALAAARFAATAQPGLYGMQDVLRLNG